MIERDTRLPAPHANVLHGVTADPIENIVEQEMLAAKPRHGHRAGWTLSMIVMGVLVGILVIVFLRFVNGPVQANALAATPSPNTVLVPKTGTSQLAGLYFDMTYPGIFDQVKQLKNDSRALEQYIISSRADYRRSMAVAVHPLEANLLDNDSNYKFRKIHPETYKERTDTLVGEPVVIMSKVDNTEETLFWPHQSRIWTVSLTSSNPNDTLKEFMTAIEPNLRWHN
jgi:hypothetical protein